MRRAVVILLTHVARHCCGAMSRQMSTLEALKTRAGVHDRRSLRAGFQASKLFTFRHRVSRPAHDASG